MANRKAVAAVVAAAIVMIGAGGVWHSQVEAQAQVEAARARQARAAQAISDAAAARDLAQAQAALASRQAALARLEAQGRAKGEREAREAADAERPQAVALKIDRAALSQPQYTDPLTAADAPANDDPDARIMTDDEAAEAQRQQAQAGPPPPDPVGSAEEANPYFDAGRQAAANEAARSAGR